MNIAIVGYGHVGKALGTLCKQKGHAVHPIDIGDSYQPVAESDVVVVCLPTPTEMAKPQYKVLEGGLAEMQQHVDPQDTHVFGKNQDCLIIIESTVGIGYTRNVVDHYFPNNDVAYSPERIDPGTHRQFPDKICKPVSGLTPRARRRAEDFYQSLGIEIYRCDSTEIAEAAKLYENTFRAVNIAFANEMWRLCEKEGVDIRAVVQAATSKGFGFMRFDPGPGVGGHCIPEDPYYLKPDRGGVIQAALWMNEGQPEWVVQQVVKKIGPGGVKGKRILIIGAAYKKDTHDRRNAPAAVVRHLLYFDGASMVDIWDPWIRIACTTMDPDPTRYDFVVVVVAHHNVDLSFLHAHTHKVFDCTGTLL